MQCWLHVLLLVFTLVPCKCPHLKSALYSTFPWHLSVFCVTLPWLSVQPLCSFLHYLSHPAVFLCPVAFHILFVQLNLRPRPAHLPTALMGSNWLTGQFWRPSTAHWSSCLGSECLEEHQSPHCWKIEPDWSYCCHSFATSFQCHLGISVAVCGLSWGIRTDSCTAPSCFSTSACRESFLAHVPVS